jgi:uncharacterized protein YaaR (DUF327 family)
MSKEIDKNILMPLLEEVRDVFTSENYLAGMNVPQKICRLRDEEEFVCENKNLVFYFECISSKNSQTAYTEMDSRLIDYAEELTTTMDSYLTQEFKNLIRDFISSITNITDNNRKTKDFSDYIIQEGQSRGILTKNDIPWYRRTIYVTVARQASAIVQMRTVTLSRRFIPLELILDAYKGGLYPFGWDFRTNTIYCLNPHVCLEDIPYTSSNTERKF